MLKQDVEALKKEILKSKRVHHHQNNSLGERASDFVANLYGSWTFIISQNLFYLVWGTLNVIGLFKFHWDPYPFILMNLIMSWVASNSGSFIQNSQNRQTARDRAMAVKDDEELGLLVNLVSDVHSMQKEQMGSHRFQNESSTLLTQMIFEILPARCRKDYNERLASLNGNSPFYSK